MLVGFASLALYGGAAFLALALARRYVLPVRLGPALLLTAAPLILTGRALVTGGVYAPLDILYDADPFGARRVELAVPPDRTPTLGDVVYQEIPWRAVVRSSLRRGELPLWNPYLLAGEPLLATQQPAIFHPATWLGFLLPLPQSWTFDMAMRLFLALLCAYLFFLELCASEAAALVGAIAWAFSDYFVFFLGYPLSPAVAPLPLLFLGLRWLAHRPGRKAVGLTVVALLLIVASGHPESLLHITAGAGLWFLVEIFSSAANRRARSLGLALAAGALTLGFSAVLLLPFAEALPTTSQHIGRKAVYAHEKRSEPLRGVLAHLPTQLAPYTVGVSGKGDMLPGNLEPVSYAGALLFPLAAAGVFARRRSSWFFLGLGVLSLSVCAKTPAADLLAKIPLFDIAINERLIFLLTFSVCALAALGAASLSRGTGTRAFLIGAALSVGAILAIFAHSLPQMRSLGMAEGYARARLIFQLAPIAIAAALLALLARKNREAAAVPVFLVLLGASRLIETQGVYPTFPATVFYPDFAVLEPIPRGEPFRFAGVGRALIPNASAVYHLEDVRGYEAMDFFPLVQTHALWCVPQGVSVQPGGRPNAPVPLLPERPFGSLPEDAPVPPGWPVRASSDRVRLVENPNVLARAFVPRFVRSENDAGRRIALLEEIHDFQDRGVIDGESGNAWLENGRATVTIQAYAPGRIEMIVSADAEALVGSSITRWPGWKGQVDGSPLDLLAYNNAFLAFRVPPGMHRIVLRYAPDSFRVGATISLATAALAFALLRRRGAADEAESQRPHRRRGCPTEAGRAVPEPDRVIAGRGPAPAGPAYSPADPGSSPSTWTDRAPFASQTA